MEGIWLEIHIAVATSPLAIEAFFLIVEFFICHAFSKDGYTFLESLEAYECQIRLKLWVSSFN